MAKHRRPHQTHLEPPQRPGPRQRSAPPTRRAQRILGRRTREVTSHATSCRSHPFNGVPVTLGYSHALSEFIVDIAGEERYLARDKMTDLFTLDSAANGVIQTLRNQLFSVSNRGDTLEHQLGSDKAKLEVAISEPELVFNHDAELEAAKLETHEFGLEVNSRENSPEALRQARLDTERRRADGQYLGWSLDLNPTEGWATEQRMTREAVIATVPAKMAEARKEWEENALAHEDNERHQPW